MPPVHVVENFQRLLGRLAHTASNAVIRGWAHDPAAVAPLADPFLAASAKLSTHWYHSLAPQHPFAATAGPLPDAEVLTANADYALTQANPDEALRGSVFRHIHQTSAATIVHNADREHVRWARYASATACPFCQILATKQKLYTSEQAATRVVGRAGRTRGTRAIGDTYHDNCKCIAVPVRPGDDYTPPPYVKDWEDAYTAARQDPDTHTMNDMVNHMRRAQYAASHPKPGAAAPTSAAPASDHENVFAGLSND